jgi:hypothetical protein
MSPARLLATQDYWRTSRATLAGSQIAAKKLVTLQECFRSDVARLAMAASSSLTAAAMRSAATPIMQSKGE